MSVRTPRLPSGLTVVSHDMADLESAALGVWIKAGSRSEEEHEHGIAHLLEHMAFKGTRNRTAIDIAEEIEAVGGELNAATSVETTSYYARVLKADVPLAVDILSDILRNSLFDRQELAKEKEVIVQEIGAAEDTPDDKVYDLFNEAAFPGQPIGRPILGTEHTVRAFRPEGIMAYLERHYTGPEMVVSAAGAVDHDALVALVEKGFSGIATQRAPRVVDADAEGWPAAEACGDVLNQLGNGLHGRRVPLLLGGSGRWSGQVEVWVWRGGDRRARQHAASTHRGWRLEERSREVVDQRDGDHEAVGAIQQAADPQISPDGTRIVYTRLTGDIMTDSDRASLWLVDVASGDFTRLPPIATVLPAAKSGGK